MKILFVEDEPFIRELFSLDLENELDVDVIEVGSGEDAIKYLENNIVEVIVSDLKMAKGSGIDVYRYLETHSIQVPFIALTAAEDEHKEFVFELLTNSNNRCLFKPCKISDLVVAVSEVTGLQLDSSAEEYCRIKTERFSAFETIAYDLYLKVSNRFVKVLNFSDGTSSSDIEKFASKGVEYLYLKTDDYLDFCTDYMSSLEQRNSKDGSHQPHVEVETVSLATEMVLNLGISDQVVRVVDRMVDSCSEQFLKNQNILSLMDNFFNIKSIAHEHSMMNAYLSCAIAYELQMKDEVIVKKLVFASLFHDIYLDAMNQNWTIEDYRRIATSPELLEPSIKKRVLEHPQKAAKILEKGNFNSPDLYSMILYHHESLLAKGYPEKIDVSREPLLTCLFNLTDKLTYEIYGRERCSIETYLRELMVCYRIGNFIKPVNALESLLKKNAN